MLNKLKETYKGKKIFLTGHTGFKGSWLLKIFSLLETEVAGYSLPPQNENDLFNLIEGEKLCNSIFSDIRNSELLNKSINDFQPDFIFHFAAQPLVRKSYQEPLDTFQVNVMGTANVLDAVKRLNKTVQIVIITTDKVYQNNEWIYPYRENDRLGGYDPYSASKACSELIVDSYRNSFFNLENYLLHNKSIAVARAGNVIGGGDWSENRLIPDIIKSLGAELPIIIRNPNSIRPWQHVLEPLLGYLILGAKLTNNPKLFSGAYNFGPYTNDSLSVEEIVKMTLKEWGSGSYKILKSENQMHEAGILKLDINKAINELDWAPKLKAFDAITETIAWYKFYYKSKQDICQYTESQILNYLKLFAV